MSGHYIYPVPNGNQQYNTEYQVSNYFKRKMFLLVD